MNAKNPLKSQFNRPILVASFRRQELMHIDSLVVFEGYLYKMMWSQIDKNKILSALLQMYFDNFENSYTFRTPLELTNYLWFDDLKC